MAITCAASRGRRCPLPLAVAVAVALASVACRSDEDAPLAQDEDEDGDEDKEDEDKEQEEEQDEEEQDEEDEEEQEEEEDEDNEDEEDDARADAVSETDVDLTYAPPAGSEVVDYDGAFPQDRVPRLDIVMSAKNYQSLQDDLTGMLGEFGAGGSLGVPPDLGMGLGGFMPPDLGGFVPPDLGGFPPDLGAFMPPEELFTACASLAAGDACEGAIFGMALAGTCTADAASGRLICQPSGFPGPAGGMMGGVGGPGLGSVDLLPRTPIYAECEIRVDELAWKHVGFRYKDNASLTGPWGQGVGKLPFYLKFDEYEDRYPTSQDQRYFGFQLLNFSNGQGDASLMRGKLAADVFAEAGIATARAAFYRVFLDRGEGPQYIGLYSVSELPQDDAFLERAFGSKTGNLYKPDGEGARWQTYDESSLVKETNAEDADFSDVKALHEALQADRSDPETWRAGLEARFNADLFLHWLAVNTVIQDSDQYGQMPHNYYLYADPNDGGRFAWIPWDHSLSMQAGSESDEAGSGGASLALSSVTDEWPLIRYLLDDEVYSQVYRDYVDDTIQGPFAPAMTIERFRETHALIAPYVTGPEGEQPGYTLLSSPEEFDQALEQLVMHVESRAQAAAEFLATP